MLLILLEQCVPPTVALPAYNDTHAHRTVLRLFDRAIALAEASS